MDHPQEGYIIYSNGEIDPVGVLDVFVNHADKEVVCTEDGDFLLIGRNFFWTKQEAIAAIESKLRADIMQAQERLRLFLVEHSLVEA